MQYSYQKWKETLMQDEIKAMTILSFPAIQLLNINVKELISSSDRQAEAMLAIANKLPNQSALVSMMDLSLEAEAFGANVECSDDEVPTVKGVLLHNEAEADQLNVPDVRAGRCGIYIDAIEKVMNQNPDRPVFAGVIGPFSLAGRLMDVSEVMIQCMMDPEYVHKVLRKTTNFIKNYIHAYQKIGANGVVIAEPLAGLMSPDQLKEFSSDYIREICDELQADDFSIIYHNCGPSTVMSVDEILSANCHAYHFGNAIDITEILKQVDQDVLVMGNIDPVKYFKEGTTEDMDAAVTELLEKCSAYSNFVISSGCDIPPLANWDNIEQFYQSVNGYNEKKRGN